jgi:hypothetical protein
MHHKGTIEEQGEREANRQRLQREKLSIAKETVICERDAATHARSKAARSAKELQPLRASDARSQRRIYVKRVGARRNAFNHALLTFENILYLGFLSALRKSKKILIVCIYSCVTVSMQHVAATPYVHHGILSIIAELARLQTLHSLYFCLLI